MRIVLLPGLDGTGVLFRPLLEALPPDLQPIVAAYPGEDQLGYADLLPDVIDLLPTNGRYVILGESFSGPLALLAAARRPAGLAGVILCASFVRCPQVWVPRWASRLIIAGPFRLFPISARVRSRIGGYSSRRLRALLSEALTQVSARVLAHRLRAVVEVDVRQELASCPYPILYLRGERDSVVPEWNLREIQRLVPAVAVARIDAPHMVLQTEPVQAAEAISKFVRECEGHGGTMSLTRMSAGEPDMPVTISPASVADFVEGAPNRKRFTRKDCEFLTSSGLLTGRYELIDGDIISKMGQSPRHFLTMRRIAAALRRLFGDSFVRAQGTVDVDVPDPEINEPEPDVSVTCEPDEAYADRHPLPREILLAVEVSDTTLRFDTGNKARLYARAGILDYWIVDVNARRLLVCRNPGPDGYSDITEFAELEVAAPLARPDATIAIVDLLPPRK